MVWRRRRSWHLSTFTHLRTLPKRRGDDSKHRNRASRHRRAHTLTTPRASLPGRLKNKPTRSLDTFNLPQQAIQRALPQVIPAKPHVITPNVGTQKKNKTHPSLPSKSCPS